MPNRTRGVTYQQLLDTDTREVPAILREESRGDYPGADHVPTSRYTSRAFHELERERMWKRVWQMACREEEIPEVGDTYVYTICKTSIIVVRDKDMSIKAFYNACLHRGRLLRHESGPSGGELQCAYHGFSWNLDGSNKRVTCDWDFPQLAGEDFSLPPVRVGTWQGFVFINMDPDCEPLSDFLADLDRHFTSAGWDLSERYIEGHIVKVNKCNWKVAQEAFAEAFHVVTTHPQRLAGMGDTTTQYDAWGNTSRAITPNGIPSEHLSWTPTQQEMFDSMVDRRLDDPLQFEIPEGDTVRRVSAHLTREALRPVIGDKKADALSDSEAVDSIDYSLFPNFSPWAAYQRIVYRFRPNGDDHQSSIMEAWFLAPFNGPRPKPGPTKYLGPDDSWTDAVELGTTARTLDQDSYNLPHVQTGLEAILSGKIVFASYQETKPRQFHHLLSQWVGEDVDG